jgi:hypothetical protein
MHASRCCDGCAPERTVLHGMARVLQYKASDDCVHCTLIKIKRRHFIEPSRQFHGT